MLKTRLQDCLTRGNLRVSDLARWLERPRATVSTWLEGREPSGPAVDMSCIESKLWLLEKLIRSRKGFPVPRLSPTDRISYLERIKTNGR